MRCGTLPLDSRCLWTVDEKHSIAKQRLKPSAQSPWGQPEGDHWLLEVKPGYVWLPAAFTARRSWLTANGYRLDHDTDESYIAVRNDLPILPQAEALGQCVK